GADVRAALILSSRSALILRRRLKRVYARLPTRYGAVSKDEGALMLRDAALRAAPQHEGDRAFARSILAVAREGEEGWAMAHCRCPPYLDAERHVIVRARRPVGHVHGPRLEIDEHGADRHRAFLARLARIGMAADRIRRAEMVRRGRAHVREGERAAMGIEQRAHAIGAVERVGGNLLQQRLP